MTKRFALAWPGVPLAVASAALFGASTPLAKMLIGEGVDPWLLASLLYLGSGLGLAAVHLARRAFAHVSTEAPVRRPDLPWLVLVALAGGVVGPVLLMLGLSATPASPPAFRRRSLRWGCRFRLGDRPGPVVDQDVVAALAAAKPRCALRFGISAADCTARSSALVS